MASFDNKGYHRYEAMDIAESLPGAGAAPFRPVLVGALYPVAERGLAADLAATRALGGTGYPVCTSLLLAGGGIVTDATDVPADTVSAQFEHIAKTADPTALKIGVLSSHTVADLVLRFAEHFSGPTLLDLQLTGPSGETVLTRRGIEVVLDRLAVPELVVLDRADAEPLSGGEIASLDDAQVAAQRLVRRGARAVVIKCGTLPARHFESNLDASHETNDVFNADLYFDGQDFALFEAPHLAGGRRDGASSVFALVTLQGLARGAPAQEALQEAKQFVTEGLRASQRLGPDASFQYAWREDVRPG